MLDFSLLGISLPGVCLMLLLIVVGSCMQAVTGIGLGLIAGPMLLFFLDSQSAIQVAIVLNLALTVCLLFSDRQHLSRTWLASLNSWAVVGIPVGFVLLLWLDQSLLKIVGALFIILTVIQLKCFPVNQVSGKESVALMRVGSVVSGVFSGALAAPGPVALWTLLSQGGDALTARATIRFYFLFAYGVSLILHLAFAGVGRSVLSVLVLLLPAMLIGLVGGLLIRSRVTPTALMSLLELVLFAMGVSLLVKGVMDIV